VASWWRVSEIATSVTVQAAALSRSRLGKSWLILQSRERERAVVWAFRITGLLHDAPHWIANLSDPIRRRDTAAFDDRLHRSQWQDAAAVQGHNDLFSCSRMAPFLVASGSSGPARNRGGKEFRSLGPM
jgi:hypothetical protein